MLRFLVIIILISVIAGGIYYISSRETKEDVEVTGKIEFSRLPGFNKEVAKASELINFAVIKGKVKNNLKKSLSNVFIKYTIDGHQTSATIFDLAPGQQIEFNTRMVQTLADNPEYYYEGIQYDENPL